MYYPMVGPKMSNTVDQKTSSSTNPKKVLHTKVLVPERKRIVSIPSKSSKDFLNQSTLTSFYQLEKKKKKMLNKIKTEKERANEMRLSDAFFITKYGSKFKLDSNMIK